MTDHLILVTHECGAYATYTISNDDAESAKEQAKESFYDAHCSGITDSALTAKVILRN